jgi:hypothetical protein
VSGGRTVPLAKLKQLTTSPTEADLAARIDAAVRAAFPLLPPNGLRHQTSFEFKFGHKVVQIDGAQVSKAQARSDILVFFNDTPLAVLELKREGAPLMREDQEQGLSYARMLHPRPPLVVITNGKQTTTLASHTGLSWEPETPSEAEIKRLIEAAGRIAVAELRHAVKVLLGPASTVWVAAIRKTTETTLEDLTGDWRDAQKPFVAGFSIPRNATRDVLKELSRGKRIVIVSGAPLAGKSSVLRELASTTADSDDLAVLFVEGDGGSGLIRIVADILTDALGWHVTSEEARAWLKTMSRQSGPALVLAIDGISAFRNELRRDIEDLTGAGFRSNLRVVLGMDDTVTPRLLRNETGRKATRIGRRASVVPVETLDDREFGETVNLLQEHRILIILGGQSAAEYRVPWVIRSLVANVIAPLLENENLAARLPPLLGPDLLRTARERFEEDDELRHWFGALAQAVLTDIGGGKRPASSILESMVTFSVRRNTARRFVDAAELDKMIDRGLVKRSTNKAGEPVVVPRLPELLASEIASLLSHSLADKLSSAGAEVAAEWLIAHSARLALGDVIGAQAILDCAVILGGLPLDFVTHMINAPPRAEKIRPGRRAALLHPIAGLVDLTFRGDGTILARTGHRHTVLSPDEDEEFSKETYANVQSWMILAHLAGWPLVAESSDGTIQGRVDPALLTEIGTCPIVLRRPLAVHRMNAVLMHELKGHGSVVSHEAGIVEPITMSMFKFLDREGEGANEWVDEAVGRNSVHLLFRIDIALRIIADHSDPPRAQWAKDILSRVIHPALGRFLPFH